MTPPLPSPPAHHAVHEPVRDDREPRTRRPMILWDRIKVLVILAAFIVGAAAYLQSRIPVMSFGEALDDQLRAKRWVLVLMGLEMVRQIHYLISERSEPWHQFWQKRVFGGWERRMERMNPWNRFRAQRIFKILLFGTIAVFFFAWKWNVAPANVIATAPARIADGLFKPMTGSLPLFWLLVLYSFMGIFSIAIFYLFFFFGGIDTYKPGEIKTRFADVWGQDPVLRRVSETVDFLERPGEIEAKGGHVPNGILLWGPPGTGKTLMAEAVAGETGKPYIFVDPSAFIQTFLGVAPMKVKWMYRKVRKLALRHGGVVVFFDEADALGNRGQTGGNFDDQLRTWSEQHPCNGIHHLSGPGAALSWQQHVAAHAPGEPAPATPKKNRIIMMGGGAGGSGALQALLTEMSGLKKPRGFLSRRLRSFLGIKQMPPPKYRILHILATNRPDTLDAALLRAGRIDRKYKVGYPHSEGRRRTFEGYFDKIRHELTPAEMERLAVMTPYYTGAMVKDLVNESVIVAMRDRRDVVTWSDVLRAKMLKLHGEADDWRYTELERHQVAVHEACHAVAGYLLRRRLVIDVATIERRGDTGGFVASIPLEERFGEWRSEMEVDVMVSLASLAGERLFFEGDNSGGVGGDLASATHMVTQMFAFWGMGPTVGSRRVTIPEMTGASSRPSDGVDRQFLETELGRHVERRLQELLDRVRTLLDENRWFVCAVAHALESHLTITGEDVEAIYLGTRGPTVDGSIYRSDWFLREYGAYIDAASQAHRAHANLAVPLPAVTGAAGGAWVASGNGHGSHSPGGSVGGGSGNGHVASSEAARSADAERSQARFTDQPPGPVE